MKKQNLFIFIMYFNILTSSILIAQDDYADLVLYNGKIITVDADDTIAEAVAVKDSFIYRVGTNAEIQALKGPETDVRNLNGKTVTPGIIDSHLHLMYYGQTEKDYVNLRPPEVTSIADIVVKIQARIQEVSPGDWIIGDGFFKLTDDRMPTKWDLDPVSPDNPVFLNSMGGHYGSANSKALEIAGIDSSTQNPVGGIIEKDSTTGEPTGVFWNHPAMDLIRQHYPVFDENALAADVLFAQELCLTTGITSFQDVNTRGTTRILGYYKALDSLKVRTYLLFTIEKPEDATISLEQLFVYQGPWLSLGGDKFLLDGQPPTSYTYEPHVGASWDIPTWNPDTLKSVVKKLHRAGHQLAFHCMGDHAIDLALDAIEEAQKDTLREDHRHRLEHCMIPTEESIDRMKELGVVVSLQPAAIYTSGDFYIGIWGAERAKRLKPLRSLLDKGIPVALGTDFPTVPRIAPKYTLWASLMRRTESGIVIAPEEKITIQEALRAQTMGSAYAAFEEDVKGSIEEGKYADMVVWSDDMYSISPEKILDMYVISTIVGGTIYMNPNTGVDDTPKTQQHKNFQLLQNYPNPFNAMTAISFFIPYNSRVEIDLLNVKGQVVKKLANQVFAAGKHTLSLDANELAGGIYLIRMKTDRFYQIKKIAFIK